MMRREYTCKLEATRYGLTAACILRIDGEILPNATAQASARMIRNAGWIRDAWCEWSKPRPVVVGQDLTIRLEINQALASGWIKAAFTDDLVNVFADGEAKALGILSSPLTGKGFQTYSGPVVAPPAPAPVLGPATEYQVVLMRTEPEERKGSGLHIDHKGRIVEVVYDNKSRRDSWVVIDGKLIDHVGAETGNVFSTADGRLWLSVEKGTDGEPAEIIGTRLRGLGWQTHYCGCGFDLQGKPVFADHAGEKQPPLIRNESGTVIKQLAGDGIPYDAAVMGDLYVVSLADGLRNGLAWSTGEYVKCDAKGVCVRNGKIVAGIGGVLHEVSPSGISDMGLGKLGASIDSLATDALGNLWLSTSAPDSLYRLDKAGNLHLVKSFDDDHDGGALFRTRVACRGLRVVWGRNNKRAGNRWEVRDVVPTGTKPPAPEPTGDPLTNAEVWAESAERRACMTYPIVSKLKIMGITKSVVDYTVDKDMGESNSLCFFVHRDGRWVGGPIDGCTAHLGHNRKSLSNATSSDKGGPLPGRYGPKSEAEDRAYLRAKKGERVLLCVASKTARERTAAAEVVWKDDTYGSI